MNKLRSDSINYLKTTLNCLCIAALLFSGAAFIYDPQPIEAHEPVVDVQVEEAIVCYEAPLPVIVEPPEQIIDTTDYLQDMIDSCVTGNYEFGEESEFKRNEKIEESDLPTQKISYSDLVSLSKVIQNEAGSSWLSMSWKMKIGEVLLNRVSSPEFPNTIDECISMPNAYDIRYNALPSEESVTAAARLLSGERVINNPSVVFQANFKQGSGVYEVLHDDILGDTYLCYSNYPELYNT